MGNCPPGELSGHASGLHVVLNRKIVIKTVVENVVLGVGDVIVVCRFRKLSRPVLFNFDIKLLNDEITQNLEIQH